VASKMDMDVARLSRKWLLRAKETAGIISSLKEFSSTALDGTRIPSRLKVMQTSVPDTYTIASLNDLCVSVRQMKEFGDIKNGSVGEPYVEILEEMSIDARQQVLQELASTVEQKYLRVGRMARP
jgi:hypothetical protein